MIILSIIVLAVPNLKLEVNIILLAVGLISNGITVVITGGYVEKHPSWFRILLIIIGTITVLLGVITIINIDFGLFTLILLLALTFIINGIARIMYGIVGNEEQIKDN